jgi:hypothetical protein
MTAMSLTKSFGPEWTILELLARGRSDISKQAITRHLLSGSLDWGELLEQALRQHMIPMLGHFVVSSDLRFDIPASIYQHLESALEWNRWQIEVFRREAARIAEELARRQIRFVVTKGMSFESTLYDGLGTRQMKDIDFMIAPADRESVLKAVKDLGYRPFFNWAKNPRREEISSRLNPDHLPKLALTVDQPGVRMIMIDVANSLTWTHSPFDVPVEEALKDIGKQPLPGIPESSLPCFQPRYQFLFTVLHLFREAWLQKFVDFGNDVTLMKFADVVHLLERDHDALTDGELRRTMESHKVTHAVAWVLRQLDETFQTQTLKDLSLDEYGDEQLLASQTQSSGYVRPRGESMRERLHRKLRTPVREDSPDS